MWPPRLAAIASKSLVIEALRLRDYRRYWLANGTGSFAMNFWFIAAAWLMLELTDSPLAVGLVGGFAASPSVVLSLMGGALADRLDRRRLLIGALACWGALAALTGVLGSRGDVEAWHVLAIAAGIGIVDAASNPAWHTLVVDLVGRSRLVAVNALAQISEFAGEIVAPIPAGLIIASMGATPLFYVAAGLLALGAGLMVTVSPRAVVASEPQVQEEREHLLAEIRGGLAYTMRTRPFPALLAISMTSVLSAAVYPLIPVYARDRLAVGAEGFGVMMVALAAGMLAGALLMAGLGDIRRRGLVIIVSRLAWFGAMAAFAVSEVYPLSLGFLLVMGASGAVAANLVMAQLQVQADDRMRGRVMSVLRITDSFDPIGAVVGGGLAVLVGGPNALLACAAVGVAVIGSIAVLSPSVWRT